MNQIRLYSIVCFVFQAFQLSFALQLNSIESLALKSRLRKIELQTKNNFLDINNQRAADVVFIFPGAGGPDQFTSELENNLISCLGSVPKSPLFFSNPFSSVAGTKDTRPNVKTLDWQEFRGSILTAAYDGEAFGEAIASILWDDGKNDLSSVHCIGVSVGAFAANACLTELNRLRNEQRVTSSPYLKLTLLDPFTSRGIIGSEYGDINFGSDVDYAEQYLNTDDPVPTTNDPLPLCACFDVTAARERNDFVLPENETMHCWPLVYYARYSLRDSAGKIMFHGKAGTPVRGSVLNVS